MNQLAERRREEKERRRDEILDAAAAVAGESGLDAITMDQVARRARLSRALLYVYFVDRTDLLHGLCQRALDWLLDRFRAAIAAEPSGRDQLSAMGRAYIAFSLEHPVLFDVLARFEAARPADIAAATPGSHLAACLAAGDAVHTLMTDALRTGIADGSIRPDVGSVDAVATVLWGFMHGVIQLTATKGALLERREVTAAELFEQAQALALQSLRGANT